MTGTVDCLASLDGLEEGSTHSQLSSCPSKHSREARQAAHLRRRRLAKVAHRWSRFMGCCENLRIKPFPWHSRCSPPCPTPFTSKSMFVIAGGRIQCQQCAATSKRTGKQCGSPAIRGKQVCRFHGGMSTGPRTPDGLARCAASKTIHGEDTRAKRSAHRAATARLTELEALARQIGLFAPCWRRK